jgi:hypothetical protein
MKIRFLLALVGLAIGFTVPAFAQEQNTVDPEVSESRVSQGRPGGARSHHPFTEGFSPSEFQDLRDRLEIFFRNLI